MSIKLDMSKAYDYVEWDYLEHTLGVMGFPTQFISLIMWCVNTASFSILINGVPKGPIVPSRDLRQGDPLSPYLFLIFIEGLVSLLKSADVAGSHKPPSYC